MLGGERELPAGPSTVWENPKAVIDEVERLNVSTGEVQSILASNLHRDLMNVYRNLLSEAHAGIGFRPVAKGQVAKNLYKDYALEVFRKPDGQIFALRLSMATDEPLQFGSIYFSERSGLQKPEHIEVNDRLSRIDEDGLEIQSKRRLIMLCGDTGELNFNLSVRSNSRFAVKPVSTEVA